MIALGTFWFDKYNCKSAQKEMLTECAITGKVKNSFWESSKIIIKHLLQKLIFKEYFLPHCRRELNGRNMHRKKR